MKRPDLLVLVAIWQFITAFLALTGIGAIAIVAFLWPDGYYFNGMMGGYYYGEVAHVWFIFGISLGILILLAYLALAVAGGIGLLQGKEWGRLTSIVHNALSLFAFPLGTVLGTLCIIYLTKAETKNFFMPKGVPPGSAAPQ